MNHVFFRTLFSIILIFSIVKTGISQDVKTLSGHTGNINSITFSPDARKIISGGSDGNVKVWSAETGDLLNTFSFGDNVTSIRYSNSGSIYGITTLSGAFLADMESGSVTSRFESKPNTYNISFSPDRNYIAVNSFYKTDHYYYKDGQKYEFQKYHFLVDLYSGSDYRLIKTLKIFEEDRAPLIKLFGDNVMESYRTNYFTSTITKDSKYLATGLPNGHISIYCFCDNNFKNDFTGHDKNVYGLNFSADGNYLVSASKDEEVKVWNISTGRSIKTLGGHDNDVNDAVFSPDSKFIASASDDETVRLWDISTGKQIKSLKGHQGDVITVAFSPDGRYVASGGKDEKIKLWNTETILPDLKLFTAQFDANIGIYAAVQQEKEAELKIVIEEYFKAKGEFETTEEYNSRIEIGRTKKQEIEDKYRLKLEEQQVSKRLEVTDLKTQQNEENQKKIQESIRDTVLKINKLSSYDADNETYTVTVKNISGKIKVPRGEAPTFKDNWKKAEVRCKKMLSDNLKYHNYFNLVVVHPVTKSEYAVDDGKKKEERNNTENTGNTDVITNNVGNNGSIFIDTVIINEIDDAKNQFAFSGNYPRITGLDNKEFENYVNKTFEENYKEYLDKSKGWGGVRAFIYFEVLTVNSDIISIVQQTDWVVYDANGYGFDAYVVNVDVKNSKFLTNEDFKVSDINVREFNQSVIRYSKQRNEREPDTEGLPLAKDFNELNKYKFAIQNGNLVLVEYCNPGSRAEMGVYIIPIKKFN